MFGLQGLRAGSYEMLRSLWRRLKFPGSGHYWQSRYESGGDSGIGSQGQFAGFKSEFINAFVRDHGINSVIEFGCGDGRQLALAEYPRYIGFDVSDAALAMCQRRFSNDPTKTFRLQRDYAGERSELALSLDVIYHLTEDRAYVSYLKTLFASATRYVIVYSTNHEDNSRRDGAHVRHRRFTEWVGAKAGSWRLVEHRENLNPYRGDYRSGSFSEFYIYERA